MVENTNNFRENMIVGWGGGEERDSWTPHIPQTATVELPLWPLRGPSPLAPGACV